MFVPVEDGTRFMAGELHGDRLGRADLARAIRGVGYVVEDETNADSQAAPRDGSPRGTSFWA